MLGFEQLGFSESNDHRWNEQTSFPRLRQIILPLQCGKWIKIFTQCSQEGGQKQKLLGERFVMMGLFEVVNESQ
jgi:hypothetical protein